MSSEKKKRVSKKQLLMGALSSVILLLGALSFQENKAGTAVKVKTVEDGDTIVLTTGKTVRLLGVNTEEMGSENAQMAKEYLEGLIDGRNIWLEYDRYTKDRYGRDLAWVWVGCESTPKFLASNFMIKTRNSHNNGLVENPIGCKKGVLVDEQIIKMGWSKVYFLSKKGEMKYEARLYALQK